MFKKDYLFKKNVATSACILMIILLSHFPSPFVVPNDPALKQGDYKRRFVNTETS